MTPECIAKRPDSRLWIRIALVAVLAAGLGACQSRSMSEPSLDAMSTASISQPSIKETALAGKQWQADPANARLGVAYARQLQALEQNEQALKVIEEVARRNPGNTDIKVYYGKQLASNGRGADAERVLQAAVNSGKADWKTHSALGSAQAQQGKYESARQHYQTALAMQPGEISVYNNIGMAYMLEGKLDLAEQTLRQAMALPGGADEPQLRQNLALALGLQGRFDESRDMASRDLPPDMVEANMAYLKRMMAQQNTWQQLKPASPSGT